MTIQHDKLNTFVLLNIQYEDFLFVKIQLFQMHIPQFIYLTLGLLVSLCDIMSLEMTR